jgi:arsenate reductase
MTITIYHNPRCSKSRQTLNILEDGGAAPTIVEYLKTPPSAETILKLADMLDLPVSELLRKNEAEYKTASDRPDPGDDAALAAWVAEHPGVLQRPIVVDEAAGKAVIGRPPENVEALL